MPDKTVVILEEELDRIHRAIANEICGSPETLSMAELEFLCDVADTSLTEVAEYLGIHRSTVTRWRKAGAVPKSVMSVVLKKWFWFKLFGQEVGDRSVPLGHVVDEGAFLSFARQEAIDKHLCRANRTNESMTKIYSCGQVAAIHQLSWRAIHEPPLPTVSSTSRPLRQQIVTFLRSIISFPSGFHSAKALPCGDRDNGRVWALRA